MLNLWALKEIIKNEKEIKKEKWWIQQNSNHTHKKPIMLCLNSIIF